uniref:Uncharacterized protein n=1 Tax=Helianthus annuus TaxID=4232 RepID=A0A251UIZ4_HELAN
MHDTCHMICCCGLIGLFGGVGLIIVLKHASPILFFFLLNLIHKHAFFSQSREGERERLRLTTVVVSGR